MDNFKYKVKNIIDFQMNKNLIANKIIIPNY